VAPFSLHRCSHVPLVLKHLFPLPFCLLSDQDRRGAAAAETSPSSVSHFSMRHGSNLLCASPPPPYPGAAGPRPHRRRPPKPRHRRNVTTRSRRSCFAIDPPFLMSFHHQDCDQRLPHSPPVLYGMTSPWAGHRRDASSHVAATAVAVVTTSHARSVAQTVWAGSDHGSCCCGEASGQIQPLHYSFI
jgi:hypothetical protein